MQVRFTFSDWQTTRSLMCHQILQPEHILVSMQLAISQTPTIWDTWHLFHHVSPK
jgi:hypothetical protein